MYTYSAVNIKKAVGLAGWTSGHNTWPAARGRVWLPGYAATHVRNTLLVAFPQRSVPGAL